MTKKEKLAYVQENYIKKHSLSANIVKMTEALAYAERSEKFDIPADALEASKYFENNKDGILDYLINQYSIA